MILVIVGTHGQPFNRLVKAADALAVGERCLIQYGHTTELPKNAEARDFIPFTEIEQLISNARVVITHAGTGTVMTALALGKVPVVAPRLARFGEHVDDHQLELVASLSELNLIVPWLPDDDLAAKVALAASRSGGRARQPSTELVDYLRQLIMASA